ncbi:hypothetical protein T484DRAFT_1918349 [Baffinella frigidus]|nr:hypothetical protein T484DRAFT_1918349 [Cryptophyta sp. CCMP2293]
MRGHSLPSFPASSWRLAGRLCTARRRDRTAGFSLACLALVAAVGPLDGSGVAPRCAALASGTAGPEERFVHGERSCATGLWNAPIELTGNRPVFGTLRLRGGARENPGDVALRELQGFRRQGLPLNVTTYNHVIQECWRGGRWREALDLYEDILKEGESVRPDRYTYNSVVGACARGGQFEHAVRVVEHMLGAGMKPDPFTYNALISSFARGGLWQKALGYLHDMRRDGLSPDRITYNSLIAACASAGEVGKAEDIVKEMRDAGGDVGKAEDILKEMRDAGVKPDSTSCNAVLSACCSAGEWDKVLEASDQMRKDGFPPDTVTFNSILIAHAMRRKWNEALTVFEEMHRMNVKPDEMHRMNVKPDVLSYNALITALANGQKFERALQDCFLTHVGRVQIAKSMEGAGVAWDEGTHTLVQAIEAGEYVTGEEEVHVDEEGNVEVG